MDAAWQAFQDAHAGLTRRQLLAPGVTQRWSVRDIIAHVSTWEEEALAHLPTVLAGGRPPRYKARYGGIDAFNALMTEKKAGLSLDAVLDQHAAIHQRLLRYLDRAPDAALVPESRFRRRLRLDTYGHYPVHTAAIWRWRKR